MIRCIVACELIFLSPAHNVYLADTVVQPICIFSNLSAFDPCPATDPASSSSKPVIRRGNLAATTWHSWFVYVSHVAVSDS